MKVISLYTGAGGLDLGLEAAGFETVVSVEYAPRAADTLRENRPEWGTIEGDIHAVSSPSILDRGALGVGEASLLVGGPPCQPFSKSAFWSRGDTRRLDDPRASTLEQYLRVLRDCQPAAFLLENVPGLGYKSKDEGIQLLYRTIEDINADTGSDYQPSVSVHGCLATPRYPQGACFQVVLDVALAQEEQNVSHQAIVLRDDHVCAAGNDAPVGPRHRDSRCRLCERR